MNAETSAVIAATDTTLGSLTADGLVAVDWWASWCGPCQMFAPVFAEAANTNTDVTFVSVDVEACRLSATRFSIASIPTLMLFKDGQLVYSRSGAISGHVLDGLLHELRRMPASGNVV